MNKRILKAAAQGLFILMLSATPAFSQAQRGNGRMGAQGRPGMGQMRDRLNLTDDQQKQMNELRDKFQAESRDLNNLIAEKRAHLKTLADTENRNARDLDRTISDLTDLMGQKIKMGIEHRDAVAKILTPEQLRIRDNRGMRFRGNRRGNDGPAGPGRMMRGQGRMMLPGQCPMMQGNGRMMDDSGKL
jgi:Spy/CpxP family protein refolding chaperone